MMFKIFLLLLVQNEKKFLFKPNDPTSSTKLDVEFTRIKGASCFSKLAGENFSRFQFHVPFRLNFRLTVCLCYPLLFCPCQCSGHKHTKEGSNKPPWLNLPHDQVVLDF